jgi:type IV pilus assembly protein PilQ
MLRALAVVAFLVPGLAHADRDLCAPGAKHHGATIDLDLVRADVHDVLRLLADVGRVNLVVGDDVDGKVTLRVRGIPWDAAACTVAAVHHLTITVQDNILLVRKATPR